MEEEGDRQTDRQTTDEHRGNSATIRSTNASRAKKLIAYRASALSLVRWKKNNCLSDVCLLFMVNKAGCKFVSKV